MTSLWLVLVEESNLEETIRHMEAFSSLQACYSFLQKKVANYKTFEWPSQLVPPELLSIAELQSIPENEVEQVYEFEHQTVRNDFFAINIFVKRSKLMSS